jgi:hypothetical protein
MSSLRTSWRRQGLALKKCLTRVYDVLLDEVSDMIEEEQNREKRLWVRDWIGRRDSRGASTILLKELASKDVNEYKICLRMTPEKFDALLVMDIEKQNTQMRDAINSNREPTYTSTRLAIALRCFTQGEQTV